MSEIKMASSPKLAERNIEQSKSYRQTFGESRKKILKMRIGETLLCLAAGRAEPDGWQLFDRLLRQLYAGNTERFSGLQSTKSTQGVVR